MTTPSIPAAAIAAWQSALSAEHAAVFAYGAIGPRLAPADQTTARSFETAHLMLRDATMAAMRAAGVDPVRSRSSYPVGATLTAAAARGAALVQEEAAAAAWRYLVSADDAPTTVRTAAITALSASAVRATTWRALVAPSAPFAPFPGI